MFLLPQHMSRGVTKCAGINKLADAVGVTLGPRGELPSHFLAVSQTAF